MRIVFINPDQSHAYDADTPWKEPLSGSESAQVYLAVAMARRGHEVFLLTGAPSSGRKRGVMCLSFAEGFGIVERADAVLVTSAPYLLPSLAELASPATVLLAWEHNPWNPDPTYVDALNRVAGDRMRILCVSDWHKKHFMEHGGVAEGRITVLKNAMAPHFQDMFGEGEDILRAKIWPPALAFTSTPYLGLETALELFARCRARVPELWLNVFSSFDMYSPANAHRADKRWQALYDRARTQPGVNYVGNVPQPQLRRCLRGTSILFYPNMLTETSSICVMEAMAAGCKVVVPPFGAIPETLSGFGEVVGSEGDTTFAPQAFVGKTLELCGRFTRGDPTLAGELREQVEFVNREYTWDKRAEQAERLLVGLMQTTG